jgi:hypothetical protein
MRALIACLVLAACATSTEVTPNQRLIGCWVNRDARPARMRWSEDPAQPGRLLATKTTFGIAGDNSTERYVLERSDDVWRMCMQGAAPRCWNLAHGESGSLEGGRVFIDGGDTVRIAVLGDGPERVIFQGQRESCH